MLEMNVFLVPARLSSWIIGK